jgi:NADPH-dependent ferric siderophore reductase
MTDTLLPNPPVRRVQRVRHDIHRRTVTVVRVDRPSPAFVRVVLADPSLAGFVSAGFDDHLKLILPGPDGQPLMRDYTPAAFDTTAGTLTLEFVLHDHGPASDWARQAQPGQQVQVAGPRGSMVVDAGLDWHWLVGDATALPAVARRLAELPADARVTVLLAMAAADRRALPGPAGLDLRWVDGEPALVEALRALPLPAGEGFAWCAAEATTAAALRATLAAKGLPKEAMRVAAYWKRGASDYHAEMAD